MAVLLSVLAVSGAGTAPSSVAAVERGSILTSVAADPQNLPLGEFPANDDVFDNPKGFCRKLEDQGQAGYGMQNRNGVSRVYVYQGRVTDPQGYQDARLRVYEDVATPIDEFQLKWRKGTYLGDVFTTCL
ncbi:hypothetical protein [Pseudonocardia sp. HH130630-07]|uniref:hypothetical protein n=1 Tax=Pseudonocardia sp. HH130630-07 TaxID=1690815 RepID=UPI000814DD7D|nr:hypothetical protein [Pseudonocardia sp. HH130630-07]ANY08416.1 hypothetical protein AFB00_21470 [Pseudonocardia sp. HH130630-07]